MSRTGKKGVLLINLGTPDAPTRGAVYRYLKQFLTDWRVIDFPWIPRQLLVRGIIAPFRSGSSAKLYQRLWTQDGSPIKIYGYKVKEKVQVALGQDYVVELGMRYQNPSIVSALNRLLEARVKEIIVFPMFAQYASATTGSVHDEVMRLLRNVQTIPSIRMISSYHDHPMMLNVFVDNARQFDLNSYDHILFSFHGIPESQLRKGDTCGHCLQSPDCCQQLSDRNQLCYSAQCHSTAFKIADKLGLDESRFTVCFQSRLGPTAWVKPYTIDTIRHQREKGAKRLLVFSPAFVADCLETIIEIGYEYQEEFEQMGGENIDLVPSLNDHPGWIDCITDIVKGEGVTYSK
ncbi:MAG: ferrochelatase [Bacteroidia bacterium]|nr:ferrochelatase [Bacteroidia bacterium]